MDIKKGDKVKFLNESGGGLVVKIIGNGQVLVQIEDGFEIPVMASQLVVTESSGSKEISKNEHPTNDPPLKEIKEKAAESKSFGNISPLNKDDSVVKPFFAFVPLSQNFEADKELKFDLYLLNDGSLYLYYTVAFEKYERCELIEKGELEPEVKVKIGTFNLLQLLSLDGIILNFLIYDKKDYSNCFPIHYRINMKSLYLKRETNYKENDFFYEPALIFDILKENEEEDKAVSQKNKLSVEKPKVEKKESDIEEVDLHIEKIMDDFTNLSSGEIVNIQMARFTTALEVAITAKTKRVVFIHGVGNGKLKYELRKTLDTKYHELTYQDASYAEYGYGATLVILRK